MDNIYERIREHGIALPSEMVVIPTEDIGQMNYQLIETRLNDSGLFSKIELYQEEGKLKGALEHDNNNYTIEFLIENQVDVEYISRVRDIYHISEIDMDKVRNANGDIYCAMQSGPDKRKSFLLQLRILDLLTRDGAAFIDLSTQRPLSIRYVHMLLKSKILPPLDVLYVIHHVYDKEGYYWLHTHGLHRCGLIELEVLGIRENLQEYNQMLITAADMMLQDGMPEEEEALFIGYTSHVRIDIVWRPWEKVIEQPKKGFFRKQKSLLGGLNDRDENHNGPSGILMAYDENEEVKPITALNEWLPDNPIFFISTRETQRMSAYAQEHYIHLCNIFEAHGNEEENYYFLVKAGIACETEGSTEDAKEHMWFVVKEVHENDFLGELINEPYDVPNMQCGNVYSVKNEWITDWMIQRREGETLTPNNVYQYYN